VVASALSILANHILALVQCAQRDEGKNMIGKNIFHNTPPGQFLLTVLTVDHLVNVEQAGLRAFNIGTSRVQSPICVPAVALE
jgi:hypothetical protein